MRKAALLFFFLPAVALAEPELFLEAELSPARVYVGQEAKLVLRVYRAPGIAPGSLRPPPLGEAGELSLLGVRMYEEVRGGVSYRVFERSNIVVPRRAGKLVVPGAQFESAAYFTEQFGRGLAIPRVARAPERVLEVLAAPASAAAPFLPARELTLEESWSRDIDALSAGEPVTRTLVLRAAGLAAERLPRLEISGDASVHVHHDQPELFTEYLETGMVGQRVQRIVLMPVSEGEVSLPALSVRWWDVGSDVERVASLPGRVLRLQSAVAPAAVPAPAPPRVEPWTLLRTFALLILVLAALSLWGYLRGQEARDARAKLRAACRRNDARGARAALIEWEKAAGRRAVLDRRALDAALYAGRAWDGKAFWRSAQRALRRREARRRAARARDPFFRLQARPAAAASQAASASARPAR